jgi:hypothetical protein
MRSKRFGLPNINTSEADLGELVENWAKDQQDNNENASSERSCIQWFLEQRTTFAGFEVPE